MLSSLFDLLLVASFHHCVYNCESWQKKEKKILNNKKHLRISTFTSLLSCVSRVRVVYLMTIWRSALHHSRADADHQLVCLISIFAALQKIMHVCKMCDYTATILPFHLGAKSTYKLFCCWIRVTLETKG